MAREDWLSVCVIGVFTKELIAVTGVISFNISA